MKFMKLLVVAYKFGTVDEIGKNLGSYDYFLNQLIEFQKRGVEVIVVAPWIGWFKKGSKKVEEIPIIRYYPRLASRSLRNLLFYKVVNKIYIWKTALIAQKVAKEHNVDVVFVRQARETGYAIAKNKRKFKSPLLFQPITTWQWHFDESEDNWLKKIIKDTKKQRIYAQSVLHEFDYFVVYNNAMKEEYVSDGANQDKFTIIPPAVKHELFRPIPDKINLRKQLNLPIDKLLVLQIGRINLEEKGHRYTLEAFKLLSETCTNARLVIIGPGTQEQITNLHKKIKELNLEQKVLFLGSKNYDTLPHYINACDVGVMPSIWFEAFGRTTIDMLSCGLPVVSTKVGGLKEANVNGVTGFCVEPKDSAALSDAIKKILTDENMRIKMSQNARQLVMNNYTLKETTNRFINLFDKINNNNETFY